MFTQCLLLIDFQNKKPARPADDSNLHARARCAFRPFRRSAGWQLFFPLLTAKFGVKADAVFSGLYRVEIN